MRLLSILSVSGWALASAASAMSLPAQQAAVNAAAYAPVPSYTQPTFISAAPFVETDTRGAASLSWLSVDHYAGARPGDSVTVSSVAQRVTAGAVLAPQGPETLEPVSYDLSFGRSWPSAISLAAGAYDIDHTPHATLGTGESGRTAEAGAMVRFGQNLGDNVAKRLGVGNSSSFGGQARWYLFAAASGKAVGLNLLNSGWDWRRAGVTQDSADALIGDAQAGFGWRKGSMSADLGYVHREVKIRQGSEGLMGASDRNDDRVALSFSIKQR